MDEAVRSISSRVRFGAFEVDTASGELHREGMRLPLQEQPFQLLCLLLERPGQVVSREEIRAILWPEGTFIDFDDGLNTAVRKLRLALGDSADHPTYIETLPKRGYRFLGEVARWDAGGGDSPQASPPGIPFVQPGLRVALKADWWPNGKTRAPRRWIPWSAILAAIAIIGLGIAWTRWRAAPLARVGTLAVLPLHDLTGDPSKAYIPAGLTEELTTELVKLQDLRVTSRRSLAKYADSSVPLREIAEKLGVDVLVEGSLVRDGNRYHLLINLVWRDGRQLWGESYDSSEGALQALQAKVALDIRRQIRPEARVQPQRHRPAPEAYDTYLRGLYLEHHEGLAFSPKVEAAYSEAIKLDPDYAQPYAGLARFYLQHSVFRNESPKEVAKGREAANRALALDPTLADAHTALGSAQFYFDWDWASAEGHFRTALRLDPNLPEAHDALGWLLFAKGRKAEGLEEVKQSRDLSGYSPGARGALAVAYIFQRQPDEAVKEANIALSLSPDSDFIRNVAAWACYEKGDLGGFMENETKQKYYSTEEVQELWAAFRAKGRAGILETLLRFMEREESHGVHQATTLAQTHALLGHKEAALRWLETAFNRREPSLVWINDQTDFDSIREDPRFRSIVHKMGLD